MNMHVTDTMRPATRRNGGALTINLALQGAGSHGAFSWGVLDKLIEDGRVEIAGIAASGTGAFNAALYTLGRHKGGADGTRALLENFWRRTSEKWAILHPLRYAPAAAMLGEAPSWRWLESMTRVFSPYEFNPLNLDPARAVLESLVDFDELYRARDVRLAIAATHVRSGQRRIFGNREITAKTLAAAACEPQLSHAAELDGEYYWDGTYGIGPMLAPLVHKSSARDLLLCRISPIARRDVPRTAAEIYARTCEIAVHAALLAEAQALPPPVRAHAISSDDVTSDLSLESRFDMSWHTLRRLRDLGREATELWLETLSPRDRKPFPN